MVLILDIAVVKLTAIYQGFFRNKLYSVCVFCYVYYTGTKLFSILLIIKCLAEKLLLKIIILFREFV